MPEKGAQIVEAYPLLNEITTTAALRTLHGYSIDI